MDITHIGHAGFIVAERGLQLVIDPWFGPAFLESWFPWPDNRRYHGDACRASAVYISHAHEDHLDRRFLAGMDKAVPVIIPAFRSRYLEREVRALGFTNVTVLAHRQRLRLPGSSLTLTVLIDASHKEDSALLVQDATGFRFLDSNDCELAISDWPDEIDLLACQFSGAFWYPHCYDFTPAGQAAKAAQVRQGNLERLVRRVTRTGAKAYLPSAGPAVFLDPALEHCNAPGGIYPPFTEVHDDFRQALPRVAVAPSWQWPATPGQLAAYQRDRAAEWGAFYDRDATGATAQEVHAHFTRLQRRSRRYLGNYARDITLSSDGRSWRIPLGLLRGELEEAPAPHYVLDAAPAVLRAVLNGDASWESALLSNRVRLHRDPDAYDATLMGLLGFGDRPAQTLAMARQREAAEVITRDGLTFQRWCPHAREDLSYAAIAGGVIECPRHHWRWDAVTGECLTGQGLALRTGRPR